MRFKVFVLTLALIVSTAALGSGRIVILDREAKSWKTVQDQAKEMGLTVAELEMRSGKRVNLGTDPTVQQIREAILDLPRGGTIRFTWTPLVDECTDWSRAATLGEVGCLWRAASPERQMRFGGHIRIWCDDGMRIEFKGCQP